jgi:hypothetical protein
MQIPTCLLYDEHGRVIAWGLEAKNASPMPGTMKCEWFKLFLEPKALRDESAIDPRLPLLPVSSPQIYTFGALTKGELSAWQTRS